jgi:hypothetical protein
VWYKCVNSLHEEGGHTTCGAVVDAHCLSWPLQMLSSIMPFPIYLSHFVFSQRRFYVKTQNLFFILILIIAASSCSSLIAMTLGSNSIAIITTNSNRQLCGWSPIFAEGGGRVMSRWAAWMDGRGLCGIPVMYDVKLMKLLYTKSSSLIHARSNAPCRRVRMVDLALFNTKGRGLISDKVRKDGDYETNSQIL